MGFEVVEFLDIFYVINVIKLIEVKDESIVVEIDMLNDL